MYKLKRIVTIAIITILAMLVSACSNSDWRTASRESANISPDPAVHQEAIIQIFGARTFGWRGWFAIHPWIAVKASGADHYQVYDVVGWRARSGNKVMQVNKGVPDRFWYGAKPQLLKEVKGKDAEALIAKIDKAAFSYPWINTYKAFPGPNSNTFVAWVGQQVPELELKLPATAIGKGYLKHYDADASKPSE